MSTLRIFDVNHPDTPLQVTESGDDIARILKEQGIRFERWATRDLPEDVTPEGVLAAYAEEIDRLKTEEGFVTADVIRLTADHPEKDALRKKFLDEHRHSEDEVRFFVEGQGLFYIRTEERIYALLCQKNDLISVPEGTRHWFDMGPEPNFTCVRLFNNPEGWVAQFSGDDIAARTPRYEALVNA